MTSPSTVNTAPSGAPSVRSHSIWPPSHPAAWPGEQLNRARALVWYHMGLNAVNVPDIDAIPDLPPFLRDHPDRPRPLTPTAEQCFRHSLELAPDHLEALRQHGPSPLHRHSFAPVRESGCWSAGAVQEPLPLGIWPARS